MYNIVFNLKDPKANRDSVIFMYVSYQKRRIKLSTRQKIHPALWDFSTQYVTNKEAQIQKFESRNYTVREKLVVVKDKLSYLRSEVERYNMLCQLNNMTFSLYDLREQLARSLSSNGSHDKDLIVEYLKEFIDQIEKGTRKKPNAMPYRLGTIKNYKNLLQTLERFETDESMTLKWEDINKSVYQKLIKWHEINDLSTNYLGKHIKDLKSILKTALEEGIHTNRDFEKRYFVVPTEKKKKIPLSLVELTKLEELELIPGSKMELSRDVFLLGCYLGLRVSDIKAITKEKIHKEKHGLIVRIITQKTNKEVVIPINTKAKAILERYDFELPKFSEPVVNRHLKKFGKRIKLSAERAQNLTIHVSRHTFAKLSYEMGITSLFIMSITGHESEKNFLRYINIQPDNAIKEFRKHEFIK